MRAVKLCNKEIKTVEPFQGLFTQGMVCHETYRDESGMWLSPEEVKKEGKKIINLKNKNSKLFIAYLLKKIRLIDNI